MNKISILLLAQLIFISYSCEYEPSEVYNLPVNRNITSPHIQMVDLNIETDTLILYGDMIVNFSFHSDNQQIKTVKLLIDGIVMGTVYSESGKFNILTNELSSGLHDLIIEVYTGSGTGSIAEAMDVEGYVGSKSWKLIIDMSYSAEVHSTIENGLLHIKWNDYKASNFKEYIIYKWGNMFTNTEIKRIKSNEFIDSSYVGEMTYYTIDIITQGDIIFSNNSLSLASDLPELYYSAGDSNQYRVKWTKSKYYNAVDSFLIFQGASNDYNNVSNKVKSTSNPNDTIYKVANACFGDELNFKLRLVPMKTNVQYIPTAYYYFESRTSGMLGYAFKFFDQHPYFFKVAKDEFAYQDCNYITRYSISQKRAIEKLAYVPTDCSTCNFINVQGSNTGKYLTAYVDCDRDIMFANGTDLNKYTIHKLQSITQGFYPAIAVSDLGTAIIQNSDGGFNIYDFATSKQLGYYKKNYNGNYAKALKISPNGDYFFVSEDTLRLVQFKNEQFTDAWKVSYPNAIKFYEFDNINPNQLIFWNGTKLEVRLCNDLSLVNDFTLNDVLLLDIDYENNEILTYITGHLLVRSFLDGSLIKDIPINFNPSSWIEACYLINHTIVYGRGLLYFIYP